MRALRVTISRMLDGLFRVRRDRRVQEELQHHLDLLAADHMQRGLARADAEQAARRSLGGLDQVLARYRDQRGWPWLDGLVQDARFAGRQLRRDGGFTASAIGVLALGIGVSHLFFTLTYAHTMRPLPMPAPDRVLFVSTVDRQGQARGLSYLDYLALRDAHRSFSDVAAFANAVVTLGGEGEVPDRVDAAYATASGFALSGAHALHGRVFAAGDEQPGVEAVVVLTERVWRSRYGMNPAVLGRRVVVAGAPGTIVGVVSDRSGFPSAAAIFLPLVHQPGLATAPRSSRSLRVFGRLTDEVPVARAAAEWDAVMAGAAATWPDTTAGVRGVAVPIDERYRGAIEGWLPFLLAGAIVVAVASANAGNLLLVRGAQRAREVAIRTALGASRGRVARQLLIESLIVAVMACVLGLAVSRAGLVVYRSGIPDGVLPYWIDYSMDGVVVAALPLLAAGVAIVFAVLPAVAVSRTEVLTVLKDGGRADTRRRASRWSGTAFLTVELALAIVLLTQVGAATVNSLAHDVPTDALLDDTRVLSGAITLADRAGASAAERRAFFDRAIERLGAVPGVTAVSLASHLPLAGATERRLRIADRPLGSGEAAPTISSVDVGAAYFTTLGLAVSKGRAFTASEDRGDPWSVIVNERLASLHFPDSDPIGRRIAVVPATAAGAGSGAPVDWRTIVGVVPDVRQRSVPEAQPLAYLPIGAAPPAALWLLARTTHDAAALAAPFREALRQLDSSVPLSSLRTLGAATYEATWPNRISARLAFTVCLSTFLLATVGLYAVVAHRMAQRRREIGLRIVLGAGAPAVVRLVVGHVHTSLAAGLLLGAVGALAWDRAFAPVRQTALRLADPTVLGAAAVTLALVVMLGCAVPIRRAVGVAPAEVLREE